MPEISFMKHQLDAIDRLHNGSILCAGVGTGKSITALGYYYISVCKGVMWDDGRIGPMVEPMDLYIITTARKRDTKEWEKECERFGLDRNSMEWPEGGHVFIDSWNNIHKYENAEGAFFIFDEQRVVGSGSWAKSFVRIARGDENQWILLSATPGDNWMDYIPVFVANGFYKNRSQFLRRHAVYNRYSKYPKVDRWMEVGYLETLRRRITVTMQFEKETESHWNDILVPYDRSVYRKICDDRWDPWKDEPIADISAACYLMRRAVNGTTEKFMANCNSFEVNKRAMEIYMMTCITHPKLIVFYNFDYELEAMKSTFETCSKADLFSKTKQFRVAEWNGHKHESIPDSDRWVYLVQYTAGAEGWNCVETNAIAFFSLNYSYKIMTQAAGRIDRINTPFTHLYYYRFVSDAPIDKAILRALQHKKSFNEKNFLVW